MIAVADTSSINYLVLIDHVDILRALYGRVRIPPAVKRELQDSDTPRKVRSWIDAAPGWLEFSPLTQLPDSALNFLGPGEREAIALVEQGYGDLVIVDELLARREATRRNLPVMGILGVLRQASHAGLLSLPLAIAKLERTNFRVAAALIQSLLAEDAERIHRDKQE